MQGEANVRGQDYLVRRSLDTGIILRRAIATSDLHSRRLLLCLSCLIAVLIGDAMRNASEAGQRAPTARVVSGAERLVETKFAAIAGKRVGLVSNHTGRVHGEHLADVLHRADNVTLAAIYAPEHGFRGLVEAGATVRDARDKSTGAPIFSLYGGSRKPTPGMLKGIDVLVFDIQDIGARFYTYISTMGLAMQAAAEAGIPFVILDRPNPLGGNYVSGFVLEPKQTSFVGRYPIPIVHGLTVGELAHMIKGEKWLVGLDDLELSVVEMRGWSRGMRWPQTQRTWVATSPNIPTFACALVYPGIGVVGETQLVNEGRGTPAPFTVFGAPWLDAKSMVQRLNAIRFPGVRFEATRYTPRSIPHVATNPKFVGQAINGVRLVVNDVARFQPLEVGIHALSMLIAEARGRGVQKLFANVTMFHRISGTERLRRMLLAGTPGAAIIAAWRSEVTAFKALRKPYLLY